MRELGMLETDGARCRPGDAADTAAVVVVSGARLVEDIRRGGGRLDRSGSFGDRFQKDSKRGVGADCLC